MDDQAVVKYTSIPPALVEAVGKDPAQLSEMARKMLMAHMGVVHGLLRDPKIPLPQRQAWMEFLAKVGDVPPKAAAGAAASGPGFSVQIIIPPPIQSPSPPSAVVVDVVPTIPTTQAS